MIVVRTLLSTTSTTVIAVRSAIAGHCCQPYTIRLVVAILVTITIMTATTSGRVPNIRLFASLVKRR